MKHYSPERKEAVLKKLLPPHNMTVIEVAEQEGISRTALYNWRKQTRLKGVPVPGSNKSTDQWSGEARFAVVDLSGSLRAEEQDIVDSILAHLGDKEFTSPAALLLTPQSRAAVGTLPFFCGKEPAFPQFDQ